MSASAAIGRRGSKGVGLPRLSAGRVGVVLFAMIALPCFLSLEWSLRNYEGMAGDEAHADLSPRWTPVEHLLGTDTLGRSVLARCLMGGAISLGIGMCAAALSVGIGVTWGALAGYVGGRTDALMMRIVDVLYGLPYILLVVLLAVAVDGVISRVLVADAQAAQRAAELQQAYESGWLVEFIRERRPLISLATLVVAIGGVSWLTMARVIRGQVLSLRSLPFIEAARACGVGPARIMLTHLLPNLIGPIVVYTTLTVPTAILQESFLSFLGIGVQAPLPSWGNLAAEGVAEFPEMTVRGSTMEWWLLLFPCLLLGLTLMALNFIGDALRDHLDPKRART